MAFFEREQGVEIPSQRIIPGVARVGLLNVGPAVAQGDLSVGDVGEGVVDVGQLLRLDIGDEVIARVDAPGRVVGHDAPALLRLSLRARRGQRKQYDRGE